MCGLEIWASGALFRVTEHLRKEKNYSVISCCLFFSNGDYNIRVFSGICWSLLYLEMTSHVGDTGKKEKMQNMSLLMMIDTWGQIFVRKGSLRRRRQEEEEEGTTWGMGLNSGLVRVVLFNSSGERLKENQTLSHIRSHIVEKANSTKQVDFVAGWPFAFF